MLSALALVIGRATPVDALPDIYPLAKVRAGQKGFGISVFSGFKIERFEVEVIDVMHNFLPKQSIILMRAKHPVLAKTGVVGGMSGSPIYIEGKMVGALAYGWRFAKEPIIGVTPIQDMLDLLQLKPRGKDKAGYVDGRYGHPRPTSPLGPLQQFPQQRASWWRLPKPRLGLVARGQHSNLVPATVPLSAAGFSPKGLAVLKEIFTPYGFEPMAGGGTGVAEGPTHFQTGGAIAVQLVTGDLSLAGTGTVTWANEKRALGFGHRMFNAGEIYVPVATARIHHTLASVARSVKISSPARQIGYLSQDRQAGILAEVGPNLAMIPMTITTRQGDKKRTFRVRLARHRILTPSLAASVISSALSVGLPDIARMTYEMKTTIEVKGYPTLHFNDQNFSGTGASMSVPFARGLMVLRPILDNPFTNAHIEKIDVDINVHYGVDVLSIESIRVNSTEVAPGSQVNLTVAYRSFDGPTVTKTYPLRIPRSLAGSVVSVGVAGGSAVMPNLPRPETLGQYLKLLQVRHPGRSLVISLNSPTQGLTMRGAIIRDLPASVMDSLYTASKVEARKAFKTVQENVINTSQLIRGKQELRLRVTNEIER